jgi:hypothetical protein
MDSLELMTFRMSPEGIEKAKTIAKKQHIPLRTLIRSWVMQRLDNEEGTSAPQPTKANGTEARTQPAKKEACPNV